MKIRRFHPSELGNLDRARLSFNDYTVEEMKFDRFGRVVMDRCVVFVANLDVDAQLFSHLSLQCFNERLAMLDFTAWEFPQISEMSVGHASCEKNVAVTSNDRSCYGYHEESSLSEVPVVYDGRSPRLNMRSK